MHLNIVPFTLICAGALAAADPTFLRRSVNGIEPRPDDLTATGAVGPGRREDLPSLEYFERLVRAILLRSIAEAPKEPDFEPVDRQWQGGWPVNAK